jgi:PPOX class probable F420-dependent enzyme
MSTVIPESHRGLIDSNQIIILATTGPNQAPQVTAMWFLADEDGTIRASLNTARQKTKNLQTHPECSIFFVDPANPYKTLEIRARAEIEPDPDYVFADKISAKYGGADLRKQDRPGETRVKVTFTPTKINTFGE